VEPNEPQPAAKVHPASREILPDDPMSLTGVEVPGDPELMLRLLVEDYARMGCDSEAILCLARDPFYVGFHGLLQVHGEEELRRRIQVILSKVGVTRVRIVETIPASERLVQIQLPPS
jgi:hypothetical protein